MEADLLRERRADTPNEDAGNPARTSCRDDCRGVVALEFALLASFLFLLLFSLIDLGLLFYDSVNLHNAERAVARRLRIMAGQGAQAQQAAIDSTLCNNLVLIDCSKVQIDVRSFDSLAEITDTVAIDGNGDMVNPRIDRVSSDQLVFVTMLYHHKMLTPVGLLLRTSSLPAVDRTTRLLVNTVFVRSEPG